LSINGSHWSSELVGDARTDGVLITGATGFIGMEVLARYLQRAGEHGDGPGDGRRIFVLVRAATDREAAQRVRRLLVGLLGARHAYGRRVVAVRGDLARSGLGLGERRDALAERIDEVVHCGASVSFDLTLHAARAVNVHGTRRVLEFAQCCAARGGLRRLAHVSTAFVAGDHAGCFSEDDLDVGQRFRNTYEQSKYEAELLLAGWRGRLPITVLRPSIVVGERATGWTASFNVLYWPLRAFARGAYTVLPARRSAPVDVVPVDYVADAICALAACPEAEGTTFHLTAGPHTGSVEDVAQLASEFFARPAPLLLDPLVYRRLVHPLLMRVTTDERVRRTLSRSEIFFPYFCARTRYDDRRARVALHSRAIAASPLGDYFAQLMRFALAADWGRRPLPRAATLGALAPLPTPRRHRHSRPRVSPLPTPGTRLPMSAGGRLPVSAGARPPVSAGARSGRPGSGRTQSPPARMGAAVPG
jgi:thioester reductase-like protein